MKICYFAGGIAYNKSAGPSAHIVNIAKALSDKDGVSVELLFNGFGSGVPDVKFGLLDLRNLSAKSALERPADPAKSPLDDVAIRGFNPVDYIAHFVNIARFFFKNKGAHDVIIERMWRLGGLCGLLLKSFSKRKPIFILEENGPAKFNYKLNSIKNIARYLLHSLQKRYATFIYKRADAIVVQTEQLKEFLAQAFKAPLNKIYVIPNGVDTAHFSAMDASMARKAARLPFDKKIVLYVGSIDAFHDLSELVCAFAEIGGDEWLFVIIGDGVKKEALLAAIKESGAKNVSYLGAIPHNTLPAYINAADVCVAPYNVQDFQGEKFVFSPLKILEYMSCGKPVITQPIGYITELIQDKKGGFLVENKKEAYANLLATISKADAETLKIMGTYNKKKAEGFSWSAQADKYINLIITRDKLCGDTLLKKGSPHTPS